MTLHHALEDRVSGHSQETQIVTVKDNEMFLAWASGTAQ